jgi:hypothetical protein
VADDVERADEAEVILRGLGYSNFERYLDGMEKWAEVGGQIDFPKGITFEVKKILSISKYTNNVNSLFEYKLSTMKAV